MIPESSGVDRSGRFDLVRATFACVYRKMKLAKYALLDSLLQTDSARCVYALFWSKVDKRGSCWLHSSAKVLDVDVLVILRRLARGEQNIVIARDYDLHGSTVSRIRNQLRRAA